MRVVPVLLNRVGVRQLQHGLVRNREVLRVHLDRPLALLWQRSNTQNVAFAFQIDVLTRRNPLQLVRRVLRARVVPNLPQRGILLAQPPHCERAQAHLPPGAQLVQRRHSIQKPHLVPQMRVLIVIREVRIQLVAFQMHIRPGVFRTLPRILHRQVVDIHDARRNLLPLFRQRHRPVETVVAEAADDLLLRHQCEHPLQIRLEPRLARHRPRIAGLLMLVVIHQDDAVARLRQLPQRRIVGACLHVHINLEILHVKIVVQLRDPLRVQLLVLVGNHLEVEANPAIPRIRKQKFVQLNVQPVPRYGIVQHLPNHIAAIPIPV